MLGTVLVFVDGNWSVADVEATFVAILIGLLNSLRSLDRGRVLSFRWFPRLLPVGNFPFLPSRGRG